MNTSQIATLTNLSLDPTGNGVDLRRPKPTPAWFVFEDREYVVNHGAKPRGFGTWAFSTKRNPDASSPDMLWSPSLTFGEAKRWAQSQIKAKGATGLVVLFVQP
jgi:hypothetical protein